MIVLSRHTRDEMGHRQIRIAFIESAIEAPDWLASDPVDAALIRAFKAIPDFGNRVLRVVHRRAGDDIFVVTAHWDRGARR